MITEIQSISATLTLFGLIFLAVGIMALVTGIKEGNYQPIFSIFIVVGLGLAVVGVVLLVGGEEAMKIVENAVPYLVLSVFLLAGFIMMIMGIVNLVKMSNPYAGSDQKMGCIILIGLGFLFAAMSVFAMTII